jgi:4-hydroxybenzoyl-CoA reductase alpha subunit
MANVLGKPLPRLDSPGKVTGETKYLNDLTFPGMLYGKVLRSPHSHARIVSINTERARFLPGVRAVITAADTPQIKFSFIQALADKYPLCTDKVRFIGDEVAAVAADDLETAERAIRLIEVEYEPLPGAYDPEKAMEPGAPLVHEESPRNIGFELHRTIGDVEEAFKAADHVFEDRYVTQKVSHCCMETRGTIAHWDATGNLTLWAPSQAPHTVRQEIARILNVPRSKVRIISTPAGGGFGSRLVSDMTMPVAAILSRQTGRPVKIVNTREEEFSTAKTRYSYVLYVKTGVNSDGRIIARQIKIIADNGAYNDKGPGTLAVCWLMAGLLYNVPNLKYDAFAVYTNKQYSTAFRGFGNPQLIFACESQLDAIAAALQMDPMELRLKNANQAGEVAPSGARLADCALVECMRKAADAVGWQEKKRAPRHLGDGKYRGIGMAVMSHMGDGGRGYGYSSAESFLKISEDGQITLVSPAAEVGQGAVTAMAMIAAEALGADVASIKIVIGDTDITSYDLGAWGSRTTLVCGNAAKAAAEAARKELVKAAATMLGAEPEQIEIENGVARVAGDSMKSATFGDIAHFAVSKLGVLLSGIGRYEDLEASTITKGHGTTNIAFVFACQIAEVEVDTKTGRVRALRIVAAHDLGQTINPLMAEGQIEGALAQGVGYALTEEAVEVEGRIKNPCFLDYKTMSAADVPEMDVILVESEDPRGPFGAKGVGEPGLVPTAAAVNNAVFDAIGVRFFALPLNAEKVYNEFLRSQVKAFSQKASG